MDGLKFNICIQVVYNINAHEMLMNMDVVYKIISQIIQMI